MFDPISPTYPRSPTRAQLARSLGTLFATYLCTPYFLRLGAFALSLILVYVAFPRSDYYAPSDCLQGFGVFVGVSLAYSPPSLPSLAGSPVFDIEDSSGIL
jgi:hypothetical protein